MARNLHAVIWTRLTGQPEKMGDLVLTAEQAGFTYNADYLASAQPGFCLLGDGAIWGDDSVIYPISERIPVFPRLLSLIPGNNPRNRALIYQLLLLLGLGYFFFVIISNTVANMEARGIKSGFGFLSGTAGFDILMSLIPYDATHTYGKTFVVGLLNTILVSIIGIFLSTIIGFLVGVANFSGNWLVRRPEKCWKVIPAACVTSAKDTRG